MELIADGLLIATAMTAGLYCLVLSRRLRRLTDSGASIGPQIEALDRALGDTRPALAETRKGVAELRGPTQAALAQLARETARGAAMARLIELRVGCARAYRVAAQDDRRVAPLTTCVVVLHSTIRGWAPSRSPAVRSAPVGAKRSSIKCHCTIGMAITRPRSSRALVG